MELGAGGREKSSLEQEAWSEEQGAENISLFFEASNKAGNHFAFFLQIVKQIVFVLIIY
jgi:hypothetical protein